MKKSVFEGNINNPAKETTGMKKSILMTKVEPPEREAGGMLKNIPAVNVSEPESDTVEMSKAKIPVQGSNIVHLGGWRGMNKRATFDSGALSEAVNVTFRDFPNVESVVTPEVVAEFTMVKKLVGDDGTIANIEKSLGKVYDCVTRGEEIFIAAEEGYVYGRVINGKFCYVMMCEDEVDFPNSKKILPTEKTRCVFVEKTSGNDVSLPTNKNVCVFSTWNATTGGSKHLPVFPCGSIDFIDNFMPLLWNEEADTARIYCICDEDGKAREVWRYIKSVPIHDGSDTKYSCWVELRRNLYLRKKDETIYVGCYLDESGAGEDTYEKYVGKAIGTIYTDKATLRKPKDDTYEVVTYAEYDDVLQFLKNFSIEDFLTEYGIEQTRDTICGLAHYWYGYGVITENEDASYNRKPGIFNYENTVAPEFDHVTFYKGRVFGSVGSKIIASNHNTYNEWELDTTDKMSSENAWMTTTTANANADGDIVAMREYMGRISVLKSGFMQEVYGGSNPFTIQDVYAVGTAFPEAVCEAYGRLCFAGKNALRTYGGGFPAVIGDELGIDVYENVKMLGNDRSILVKTGDKVYKYDFLLDMWEERQSYHFADIGKMIMFGGEMHAITSSGELIKLEGKIYGDWEFETDAMTENTLSLKRLSKLKITYEIGANSTFVVEAIKSDGNAEQILLRTNAGTKTILQRAEVSLTNVVDWFLKLRFRGEGYFKLVSMDMEIKNGGEVSYE